VTRKPIGDRARTSRNERVASFRKERCLLSVETESGDEGPQLVVVESVRCLECGAVYAKPSGGGTVRENPGCPDCGYVGWMTTEPATLMEALPLRRSAAGRQRYRSG
jgi:hypothetical protein